MFEHLIPSVEDTTQRIETGATEAAVALARACEKALRDNLNANVDITEVLRRPWPMDSLTATNTDIDHVCTSLEARGWIVHKYGTDYRERTFREKGLEVKRPFTLSIHAPGHHRIYAGMSEGDPCRLCEGDKEC